MYATTTKEVKTMTFRINSQNIEQAFGIQVTFITEIKPQKNFFFNIRLFFGRLICLFGTPVKMGMGIRMPQPKH